MIHQMEAHFARLDVFWACFVAISVPEFLLLLAARNQKAGRVGVNGPNLAAANAVSFKAT
jgi:hypothetical protein